MHVKLIRKRVGALLVSTILGAATVFPSAQAYEMTGDNEPQTEVTTQSDCMPDTELDQQESETDLLEDAFETTETEQDDYAEMDEITVLETNQNDLEGEAQEDSMENCSCGAEDLPIIYHEITCPIFREKRKELCDCEVESEDPMDHLEECAFYQFIMEEAQKNMADQIMPMATYKVPGTSLPYSGSGFSVVSTETSLPAEYKPLTFTSVSSSEEIGTPSANLVKGQFTYGTGGVYWYPKSKSVSGTFGMRYNKVLFDNGQWYDLKCVVTDWAEREVYYNGAKSVTPCMCFDKGRITFWFECLGQFTVKCTLVKTGTDTVVSKKFRVIIKDIDAYQGVGIRTGSDTQVDSKRVYDNSKLYYSPNYIKNGLQCGDYLVGIDYAQDDPWSSVIYDFSGSEFYLTMGEDNAIWFLLGEENAQRDRVNAMIKKGETIDFDMDIISIYDSVVNPQSIGDLEKYVSRDGSSWTTTNEISGTGEEFFYKLRHYVPEEEGINHYSKYVLSDILPDGVDYADEVNITCMETGEDVSGQFSITTQGDEVIAVADPFLLNSDTFYGHYYDLIIKVSFDPTEITEQINSEGEAVYIVRNLGTAVIRHEVDTQDSSVTSNYVTTTGTIKETMVTIELTKEIDAEEIVWSHGALVFLFKIQGTDTSGNTHTYYESVEFTPETSENNGKLYQLVKRTVPAGTYTVSEEKTARYHLEQIKDVKGGNVNGKSVVFHLEGTAPGEDTGKAIFYDVKITDEGLSDASFVKNIMSCSTNESAIDFPVQ